ncbi:YycH family regulatory protein [Pseudalkalibacillus berkeleyi]|uniref:Two-component system activity regulator YycH n=1 Tax=Pseudalkalibacillus berkeleyi TaxID=1069813 RepID=A0ABS9H2A3_9BACL|nr:two-component system activity regulator YycH [Pseudalkalibacillus berkeleyi]MCF6139092.1 two-component system activity regulator YycH [Pseudalkalibacillus berkeleyi]
MDWKRIVHHLNKFYTSIWDNIEKIKSALLFLLIALSIFLTWNLWTYTPNINVLENEAPIKTAIEEGKKERLSNIIQPKQIIIHQDGKHFWAYAKSQKRLYKQLQSATLVNGEFVNFKQNAARDEIEIIYPTSIPLEVLKETFTFSNNNFLSNKSGNVEKVQVFKDNDQWKLQFVLENPPKGENPSDFKIPQFELTSDMQNTINSLITKTLEAGPKAEVSKVYITEEDTEPVYLPKEKMEIKSYSFFTNEVNIDQFVKALLLSKDVASRKFTNPNKILYMKLRNQITYYEDSKEFTYINWKNQEDGIQQNPIIQSLDFMNNHQGWIGEENDYHLYHYDSQLNSETKSTQKDLHYRMVMQGFPVVDDIPSNSISKIEIEWMNNQAGKYSRSLMYPHSVIEWSNVTVPDGEAVKKALERKLEVYPTTQISDVMLGYKAIEKDPASGDYVLTPTWYYKGLSSWIEIDFDKNETPTNKGG